MDGDWNVEKLLLHAAGRSWRQISGPGSAGDRWVNYGSQSIALIGRPIEAAWLSERCAETNRPLEMLLLNHSERRTSRTKSNVSLVQTSTVLDPLMSSIEVPWCNSMCLIDTSSLASNLFLGGSQLTMLTFTDFDWCPFDSLLSHQWMTYHLQPQLLLKLHSVFLIMIFF